MKFENVNNIGEDKFRRLSGVRKSTFEKMVIILKEADREKKSRGGRNKKLCIEDQLLMMLEYLREYRTYYHISQSYGVSESSAYKTIRWVEDTLIKHPEFTLPGKKVLLESDTQYEVVLVDATETPIERPKKGKRNTIQAKEEDTL